MGLYVHEGTDCGLVVLRELVTDAVCHAICAAGFRGSENISLAVDRNTADRAQPVCLVKVGQVGDRSRAGDDFEDVSLAVSTSFGSRAEHVAAAV